MKTLLILALACCASAQTTVYMAAGGPAGVAVNGASAGGVGGTQVVVSTFSPHGFSSSCNTTTNVCYCGKSALAFGAGISAANGYGECVPIASAQTCNGSSGADSGGLCHLALYDTSGNPIEYATVGNWWSGNTLIGTKVAQYLEQLTPFTIPANPGPLGYLDGTGGDLMNRLSYLPPSLTVSSCSGSSPATGCVVTWTTNYNQSLSRFPMAAGQNFSITGTGTVLDTCGSGGGAQSPYTIATVSGSGTSWTIASTAFTCSGMTNQTISNDNCGPNSSANDLIYSGTAGAGAACQRVSQIAYTGNPFWSSVLSSTMGTSTSAYKSIFDGGAITPGTGIMLNASASAIRFLVDPTNATWLAQCIYWLNHDYFASSPVGYPVNNLAWVGEDNSYYNYGGDPEGISLLYGVVVRSAATSYWISSEQTTFKNRQYNDIDNGTVASTLNQDAGNQATHNWVLDSGLLAAGTNDATHIQLPSTSPYYSTPGKLAGAVIMLAGSGVPYNGKTYATISNATSGSTGVLTLTSSITPVDLAQIVSGQYNGGSGANALTCTGSTGQFVQFQLHAPGGSDAYCQIPLSSANTVSTASNSMTCPVGSGDFPGGAPTSVYAGQFSGSASCSGGSGSSTFTTTLGTPYTIFDTVTINTTTSGASATYQFGVTNNPGTLINVGDAIMGYTGWGPNFAVGAYVSVVTAITPGSGSSPGTVTAINSTNVTASSTPSMAWRLPAWQAGDTGRVFAMKNQLANAYGTNGGYSQNTGGDIGANGGMNDNVANGAGADLTALPIMDLVMAPDDPRAIFDLSRTQPYFFHYGMRPCQDYDTGKAGPDGPGYTTDSIGPACSSFMWTMTQSIPTFPLMGYGTTWGVNQSLFFQFETIPGTNYLAGWSIVGMKAYVWGQSVASGPNFTAASFFAPTSPQAKTVKDFMINIGSTWANVEPQFAGMAFLYNDPRVGRTAYTTQPYQHCFVTSGSANITANTGWPNLYRGDMCISYGYPGWNNVASTYVQFDHSTYRETFYDFPRVGQTQIAKAAGSLVSTDNQAAGALGGSPNIVGDTFEFGNNSAAFQPGSSVSPATPTVGIGYAPVTQYTFETAGSWGQAYGDANSNFMAALGDVSANYNTSSLGGITIDHCVEGFAHQKYQNHDEFVAQFTDCALASGSSPSTTQMNKRWHYTNNGTPQGGGGSNVPYYTTGLTNCASLSGSTCALPVTSLQSGVGSMTYGIMTAFESPNTVQINDDCQGLGNSGQCSTSSTYSGGDGYSHRISVNGGSSSTTAVSKYQVAAGHKIMTSLTDTTFTSSAMNPDANWTGIALTGHLSTGVFLWGLGGLNRAAITSFNTSSISGYGSGTTGAADWILEGLNAGTYYVAIGGTQLGAFVVQAGDNSIEFSTTASGAFVLSQTAGSPIPTAMFGKIAAAGSFVIR